MKRIASSPLALILASFNLALTAVAGETNAVRRVSVDEFEKLSLA
jgi:hypothetical protein